MPDPDPAKPKPTDFVEAEVVEILEETTVSQPLINVGQPVERLPLELELQRQEQQHELEMNKLRREEDDQKHLRKKEVIDRVFGHLMRFTVVAGGIALFPLHYPVVGGLLLGAGLDLLTKSELRNMLVGAIKEMGKKGRK